MTRYGALAIAATLALAGCGSTHPERPSRRATSRASTRSALDPDAKVPLRRLVGQMVMAGMDGTSPSADLLSRVRAGELGGIIVYADNVSPELPAAIRELQAAAASGGNPPLLISTDQEGGDIRRFSDGPPFVAPPDITTAPLAQREGQATGRYLKQRGVNVDLAPVSDVALSSDSFLVSEGRGFRGGPSQVAALATAFAGGVQQAGVAACAKHFPGVGALREDTDFQLQRVPVSRAAARSALVPFEAQVRGGVQMVMVASAVYPSWDPSRPAGFSRLVVHGLLRRELGFGGVVITDALDSPDALPGDTAQRAVYAAAAGADVILFKPSGAGAAAFGGLLRAARTGTLSRRRLEQSYDRIRALKRQVAQ